MAPPGMLTSNGVWGLVWPLRYQRTPAMPLYHHRLRPRPRGPNRQTTSHRPTRKEPRPPGVSPTRRSPAWLCEVRVHTAIALVPASVFALHGRALSGAVNAEG